MSDQLPAIRIRPFKQAVLGGYDRAEVDNHIRELQSRIDELERASSPQGAVQRALEQVGDEVSGILQRAHETAGQLTDSSRRAADDRLEQAGREAAAMLQEAQTKLHELDLDTDRIWAERDRIVSDVRELAGQLVRLADDAVQRFPPAEEDEEDAEIAEADESY